MLCCMLGRANIGDVGKTVDKTSFSRLVLAQKDCLQFQVWRDAASVYERRSESEGNALYL